MQTIGTLNDGRRLAILTSLEFDILELIDQRTEVRKLSQAPSPATEPVALHKTNQKTDGRRHPWRAAIAAEVAGRKIHAVTGAATEAGKPICRTCGKPITRKKGQNGMTPKCCSAACLKEFKRIYARDNWRKRHGKTTARSAAVTTMPPNPSDPFLTDEQRKEMMARREKLIAASAQKHAED